MSNLHLVKLCVGIDDVGQLFDWQSRRISQKKELGEEPVLIHTTRMTPKRSKEILSGGSLYWVIKRVIQVRNPIVRLDQFTDEEGIGRCNIVLRPEAVLVHPQPRRPFQGWRYLKGEDAPLDLPTQSLPGQPGFADDTAEIQRDLAALGLL